jgi:deazaflavin-dependent oxidoreductase (nitroreductase family)
MMTEIRGWERQFYRLMNPICIFRVRRLRLGGRGVDLLRVLVVRGRTTGRRYQVPVRVAVIDGQRYIMTMMGDTQWARNLRAAGEAELILGSSTEKVRTRELEGQEQLDSLIRCCRHRVFERRARTALARVLGLRTKHLTRPEIELLAQIWFVFRCEPL